MKKYLLTSFLVCCIGLCFAQDSYYVTVVKGTAFKIDGSAIKPGTKLLLTDKVKLDTKGSVIILLHPSKGRFVVSSQNAKASADNKFVILIKDFLELHAKNVRLSSRAIEEAPVSLEAFFKTDPAINNKFLIIDTLRVKLPGRDYAKADNAENFFFLQLIAAKPMNHKLNVLDRTLLITRENLIFDGTLYSRTAGKLNLGFIENYTGDKKAKLICPIEAAFMTRQECIDIMKGIKQAMAGQEDAEILKEIYTQIYQMYGKPDSQMLGSLYNQL